MPITLPDTLKQPRYKRTPGYEGLLKIFTTEMLYNDKMAVVEKKYGVSHMTAVRWYKAYRMEKK